MSATYRLREGAQVEGWQPGETRALDPAAARELLAAGLIVPTLTGTPIVSVSRGPPRC